MLPPSLAFLALDPKALPAGLSALGVLGNASAWTPEDLADAKTLRSAIARAAAAAAAGSPPDGRDVATLNAFAADDPPLPVLRADGTVARTALDPSRAAFAALARDAIDTIGRYGTNLQVCQRPGCGAVFVTGGRGPRRRWCSMTRCGNREKVAAFRNRVRGS